MNKCIQINQLLLEREARFAELFEIERQLGDALGGRVALAPPSELPSLQKRRRRKRMRIRASRVRIRELDGERGEFAYRLIYRARDERREELHTDAKAMALLVNTPLEELFVERIEIVAREDDETLRAVETLFARTTNGAT